MLNPNSKFKIINKNKKRKEIKSIILNSDIASNKLVIASVLF